MWHALERHGLKFDIPAEYAPNEKWRTFLADRRDELDSYLRPATDLEIAEEVQALIKFMAAREGDIQAQAQVLAGYIAIVRGVPLAGLRAASLAYLRNEIGDKWLPTPGEFRQAALKISDAEITERTRIGHILSARILPPIDREKSEQALAIVREAADAIRMELSGTTAEEGSYGNPHPFEKPDRRAEKKSAEEWLTENQGLAPPLLSEEALRAAFPGDGSKNK